MELTKVEWCKLLDNYLINNSIDGELYERCNEAQVWLISEVRKSMSRINNK